MKKELIGLSKQELQEEILSLGEKPFRAKQLWQWLYFHGQTDFEQMSSFSKEFRKKLSENYTITRPKIVAKQLSKDKTCKWLLEFSDGQRVEMVYIPEEDRGAVCISTQVGCAVGCKFCHTGSQKLTRNLTAGEIVSQFMVARDTYGEWPSPTNETRYLSNIVVMGMGEPLHNVENVIKALMIGSIEITNGCLQLGQCSLSATSLTILASTIIAFGGLSVFMQSLGFLNNLGISKKTFLTQKITRIFCKK